MGNHKLLLLVFLSTLCTQANAYDSKDGNVTASIGSFIYKSNFNGTDSGVKSPVRGGFGILVGGDISDKASLEVGLFHMNKPFLRQDNDLSIVEESQLIHISMGYRRWLNPYLSALVGFYSAYPMDEPKVVHNDFPTNINMDTSARDLTEYGFDFSIQSELWHDHFISIIADARYSLSVTSKVHEQADHYGVLLAIRYLVQEKIPNNDSLRSPK